MLLSFQAFSRSCLVILTLVLVAASGRAPMAAETGQIDESLAVKLLSDDLWNPRDAYDAGHYLMVPLHYAYPHSEKLRMAFREHFARLLRVYDAGGPKISGIDEMQYLAMASRYLALDAANPDDPELNERLARLLERRISFYWQEEPAWQWEREPFAGGIKERLQWKLSSGPTKPSYLRVIFDQEMYIIGMATDLAVWKKQAGEACGICNEALETFDLILDRGLDRSAEGWRFQVGVWADHPDYDYAGYLVAPGPDAERYSLPLIQEDSSHAHRWPLWLLQLSNHRNVSDVVDRLRWQLLNRVIDPYQTIGVPVLRNFLSSHNGYYRYGYDSTKPEKQGYGPYQLSGTFGIGWWSFLGGTKLASLYDELVRADPLNRSQLAIYKDLSTREPHPIIGAQFRNGFRAMIARMAAILARDQH